MGSASRSRRGGNADNSGMSQHPRPPARRGGPSTLRAAAPKSAPQPAAKPPAKPLSEAEMERLEALLDSVPAPLEPLDLGMLDGYLVGVLLQPKLIQAFQWMPFVLDSEGRKPPAGFDSRELTELVKRRHQELNRAITGRQWFDPWVFELEDEAELSEALLPWVAGFALAAEEFPELMRQDAASLLEPLAAIYRHLDPDDLEDADELLEEIETLEPPADLEEAVESLVAACLMLADVTRPQQAEASAPRGKPPARRGPPQRGRY